MIHLTFAKFFKMLKLIHYILDTRRILIFIFILKLELICINSPANIMMSLFICAFTCNIMHIIFPLLSLTACIYCIITCAWISNLKKVKYLISISPRIIGRSMNNKIYFILHMFPFLVIMPLASIVKYSLIFKAI